MNNDKIEEFLFRNLINNSNIPLLGSILIGFIVVLSHMNSSHREQVIFWFIAVCLVTFFRYLITQIFISRFNSNGYDKSDASKYALTLLLTGLVWGGSGIFLFQSSPIEMVVTLTAIHGMTLGGALTLGAYLPAFYAFSLSSIIPLIFSLVFKGGYSDLILAFHAVIFSLLILGIAKKFNSSLKHVFMLTIEKEALMQELAKANEYQKNLANTDGLTGIANRRKFDSVLEKEINRFSRTKSPLSLIILDVDFFKTYNDNYGHVTGDDCLIKIANLLDGLFKRSSDLVARYGGEEFAVILPDTNYDSALELAEVIRKEVVALKIKHEFSPQNDHITISVGVFTLADSNILDAKLLVAMADECLYKAKAQGRNRVVGSSSNKNYLCASTEASKEKELDSAI